MVLHRDDDNQSSPALLVTDTILVAHILRHPEGILVVNLSHNDEHILYATLQLQFLKIEIGRILLSLINISIRVGNILRRIPEERNRYIFRRPNLPCRQRQCMKGNHHQSQKISLKSHNFSILVQKYAIKTLYANT